MDKNIIISSDSTSDLSAELKERYNIKIIPLGVTLGTEVFRDGIDITPDEIYEHHKKTGELPKTTAANVGECEDFFAELTKDGSSVVHFTISAEMSSTHNNSAIAASDFENVYVVDTRNLSTGGGLLVIAAAEMAKNGMDAKTIAENCRELAKNVSASFVIDNLDYLHKGGRCSGLARFGANMLKLRPEIVMENGTLHVGKMYRGSMEKTILDYIRGRLENEKTVNCDRIFVTHSGVPEEIVEKAVALVKELRPFEEVVVTVAGSTISCHCGPACIGVLFFRK